MILIGTAGYSYDDWIGPVYPEGTKKGEMLEFYAREFMFTEINSSYYAMPNRYMFWNLVKKTPEGFQFVVKAHQSMTHKRSAGKKEYDDFMAALEPLLEAGKMGGILTIKNHTSGMTTFIPGRNWGNGHRESGKWS